jgi:choline kinase/phosphatidylglycerophosphate synthase
MECLILAAGQGSRLRQQGESKPLVSVLGIPLLERVIRSAMDAGADDFYVVTGYQGERVRSFINQLTNRLNIRITSVINDEWEKENGLSVLKAREYLDGPFLLLMADHLFDSSIARKLIEIPLSDNEIILCVDSHIHNPIIDLEDVTRVKTDDGKILDIGKNLADFNGFDTGIFLCSPAIFNALEQSANQNDDTTLSGAVKILAADGRAKISEISGNFWIDVDDSQAFRQAEEALLANLRGKLHDGPVSQYLNRPLSIKITRRLAYRPITPNQISLFSFICSMLAACMFALGGYFFLLVGGVMAQFASIIDGCDGEVARLKYLSSDYGGWFDAVLDRYADAFLLFGLTWHVYSRDLSSWALGIGFLAIIGSFMLSYTADKYDNLMKNRIQKGVRMGRDVRVFLIFLGAILNQAYLVLIVVAVLMNLETIRRIVICRNDK